MSPWMSRAWPPSRIGLRLFAFNLLVVFVPVAGVLYLDVYESRLLRAQERAMVQQARLLAAAASAASQLRAEEFDRLLSGVEGRSTARFRLFDATGALVADSKQRPGFASQARDIYAGPAAGSDIRQRVLYRLGAAIANARQRASGAIHKVFAAPAEVRSTDSEEGVPPEVLAALAGQYGAATRPTPHERSLTLFSAVPVWEGNAVIGAVVVSQSTLEVLQSVYDVRLRIFEIVIASLLAATVLTTIAAMTIVKPLRRLRRQATALAERRRPLSEPFPGTERKDELGDVARAFEILTRRLDEQIHLLEGFTADVAHEFKNPLASIRTAAEMVGQAERVEDRERFLVMMLRDVDRLERLVSGAREAARVDGQLGHASSTSASIRDVLTAAVGRLASRAADVRLTVAADAEVKGSPERLAQVFDNLLANAVSLTSEGSEVEVTAQGRSGNVAVTVADRGPGIPDDHLERIFERFFSYRPQSGRGDHVGLGLSIARRIVESYGGTLSARNREGGGAVFEVTLNRV
jgi:two-component system, OmpR family, sensor histidine kinase ChvG